MRTLLPRLKQPSRYTGIEQGAVHKEKDSVRVHLVLCFPDLYDVGMSHLGQKILYGIVNQNPAWWAERCYEPDAEACALLRATNTPLASLESDTPLNEVNILGFSITHELCYTDVLNMLSLSNIPLRTKDRPEDLRACPLVTAGGGAAISAEPMAPFLDCVVLGDGEETLPELMQALEEALACGMTRSELLRKVAYIPGIYVPSLFAADAQGRMQPLVADLPKPSRRIVADFDKAYYPTNQVVPVATVHNRLSLEIARGCTRGCRFCNAGFVYRPSRERQVDTINTLLTSCLEETGFDEISFLALSAGDYSALKHLCSLTLDRCASEQIALSLPSLRVGSIDDAIMDRMARLRRTGVTLAPEAGSQRLRDVINKGITEEQLITHVQKLLEYGWRQVKLYFMIGLPTETDEDLLAIVDLCRKVREAGGPGRPKLAVTAALSPFVPKPFTPFQWEEQISLPEIDRRVHIVLEQFKKIRGLTLRWHEPSVSHLEGLLSRAGREMADVVEKAYEKGAILCGWKEHFTLTPWLEAMQECGLDIETYKKGPSLDAVLPWAHLECGVSEEFLRRELERAKKALVTPDCRYNPCRQCGACDRKNAPSLLPATPGPNQNRLVYPQRDQIPNQPARDEQGRLLLREISAKPPEIDPALTKRIQSVRFWHTKEAQSAYLSQLELQAVLDRALRRANVPMAFSQGFHPMPLLSFGRALPVGVESQCEWFSVTLRQSVDPQELSQAITSCLPQGLRIYKAEIVPYAERTLLATSEEFSCTLLGREQELFAAFADFAAKDELIFSRETKKGLRSQDIRPLVANIERHENCVTFCCDWARAYLSPLLLCQAILAPLGDFQELSLSLRVVKTAQFLPGKDKEGAAI